MHACGVVHIIALEQQLLVLGWEGGGDMVYNAIIPMPPLYTSVHDNLYPFFLCVVCLCRLVFLNKLLEGQVNAYMRNRDSTLTLVQVDSFVCVTNCVALQWG